MSDLRKQLRAHYEAQTLPDDKVDAILLRGRLAGSAGPRGDEEDKVLEFPQPRRRRAAALALAAGLAVFAGLLALLLPGKPEPVSFALLAPRVVEFFSGPHELSVKSNDKAALRAWHLAKGAPERFQIPTRLLPLESFGCEVLDVQGRPAYLTCFWREKNADGSGKELVHLLVARREDFRDAPASAQPQWREMNGWSFASWSEGDVIYTIAAAAPAKVLEPFIGAIAPPPDRLLAAINPF
jgi:hypothetical protein